MELIIKVLVASVISYAMGWLLGYLYWREERRELKKRTQDLELFLSRSIANTCVRCGKVIPEGRQVCPNCEEG